MNRSSKPDWIRIAERLAVVVALASSLLLLTGCTDATDGAGITDVLEAGGDPAVIRDKEISKPTVSEAGPWPKAIVQGSEFDFGRMQVGTKMNHSFTIVNDGDAPLELVAGKATCKCTHFDLSTDSVPPGESATLFVEWHGKFESAAFQHGGKVYTNDPNRESIRFNVKGIVDAPWKMLPADIWVAGHIIGNEPSDFSGKIFSGTNPDFAISDIASSDELTTVSYEPMSDEELKENNALSGYNINVTVQPGTVGGVQRSTLTVSLADSEETIQIPVEGLVHGPIQYKPMRGTRYATVKRRLILGQFPASKGRKAEMMLVVDQNGFDRNLEFLEVTTSPKSLKVTLEPIGAATGVVSRYKLTVEVPPGGMSAKRMMDKAGFVHCVTNHPLEKEIRLEVEYTSF